SQNALNGSVKTEAQDLTKILRESLGENTLVPAPAKPVAAVRPRGKAARKAAPAPAADADAGNGSSGGGSGPNPFGNLK
ncbi:hypothetical protein ABTE84_21385, partial [Acinetobacter baumannii]